MTLLEQYQARREICEMDIENKRFLQRDLLDLQELDYRISVLSTIQSLLAVIPISMEIPVIAYHYQVITSYFDQVVKERRFGPGMDEQQIQRRDEALKTLEDAIKQEKERFMSFEALTAISYRKSIGRYYAAVLPLWLRYRQTYILL